jgi:hypothetical protein
MTNHENEKQDPGEDMLRTAYLINGYIRNNLTEKEHNELDDWVTENIINQRIFETMTEDLMELHIEY